ncbi:hypothetical protein [Streptomyces sp. A012304]|nr:hypothetical protein [Streptomyces sp. A012304]
MNTVTGGRFVLAAAARAVAALVGSLVQAARRVRVQPGAGGRVSGRAGV